MIAAVVAVSETGVEISSWRAASSSSMVGVTGRASLVAVMVSLPRWGPHRWGYGVNVWGTDCVPVWPS